MKKNENFEPFGDEWVKEMMKFKKEDLVATIRHIGIERMMLMDRIRFLEDNAGNRIPPAKADSIAASS